MEDSIEKRKYIYKVIPDISKNNEVIINFLKINNIPQTENANGIFVNLAVLSDDKSHYILHGQKIYITNGSWASVCVTFAKVD